MSDDNHKRQGPPQAGPGRPPGALNRITKNVKEAMLEAAVLSDHAKDQEHPELPGTLTQYMLTMEREYPALFFQAICKLLPKEVRQHLQTDTTVDVTYRSVSEVKTAMLAEGLTEKQIQMIEAMLPVPLEEDEGSVLGED